MTLSLSYNHFSGIQEFTAAKSPGELSKMLALNLQNPNLGMEPRNQYLSNTPLVMVVQLAHSQTLGKPVYR